MQQGQSRARILAVDDTPANLKVLRVLLETRGYDVQAVGSGDEALDAVSKHTPDLVLLDVNMPPPNGLEVCKRMKDDRRLKDVPIIFLSALNDTATKVRGFHAGAVDYITKPFEFDEVRARVDTHLKIRRLESELRQRYDDLRKLEELRDNLVHMLVHDLRSPLAGIMAYLDLLKTDLSNAIPEENLQDIKDANQNCRVLMRMINDILDISRLEGGKMPLNKQHNNVSEIIHQAINSHGVFDRDISIHIHLPEERAQVWCDAQVLERMVANLVGNAIKFSRETIEIRVTIEQCMRIFVIDDGPGIQAEYQDCIFEKFGQASSSKAANKPSTGLGLAFCKLATEAHGGTVGVQSFPGQGSTFWLELPCHELSAPEEANTRQI